LVINQMNGAFVSQKLILKTGSYKLTEFLLLDATGNAIYAIPLAGSQEASNVTHPLSISFDVVKDASALINVEVLSTDNKSPGDFGLVSFPISGINVINFMVISVDKASSALLSAKLTVSGGSYIHIQKLDSLTKNLVTIKENPGLSSYTLTIEKTGYFTYSQVFTKDTLKLFNTAGNHMPLLVELERDTNIYGTVTDIDGNIYRTVKINNQWWMAENLKVTHYRNGDPIPNVTDNTWASLIIGAYCDYNNDPTISMTYGRLYNYYARIDSRNLAPIGWHIATNADWGGLYSYLGGLSAGNAGAKLKEVGTTHWQSPNAGSTNASGFTALPAGYRWNNSLFYGIGTTSIWAFDLIDEPDDAMSFVLYSSRKEALFQNSVLCAGTSARCVKD